MRESAVLAFYAYGTRCWKHDVGGDLPWHVFIIGNAASRVIFDWHQVTITHNACIRTRMPTKVQIAGASNVKQSLHLGPLAACFG